MKTVSLFGLWVAVLAFGASLAAKDEKPIYEIVARVEKTEVIQMISHVPAGTKQVETSVVVLEPSDCAGLTIKLVGDRELDPSHVLAQAGNVVLFSVEDLPRYRGVELQVEPRQETVVYNVPLQAAKALRERP